MPAQPLLPHGRCSPPRCPWRAPVAIGLLACGYASGAAQAACQTEPFQFRPTQNAVTIVNVTCDREGGQFGLRARNAQVPAAVTIVGYPLNGEMTVHSRLTYSYRPHRRFRGLDEFSVRVCAVPAQGQQGCATLNYRVTVK